MSAAVSTLVSVSVLPSGLVMMLVTVSPTAAFVGSVTTSGVPPRLAASAALTPLAASGNATAGWPGPWVSSTKLPVPGWLVLQLVSVMVVLVLQVPSTLSWALGMFWVMVKG